jgi:hypothetical protein
MPGGVARVRLEGGAAVAAGITGSEREEVDGPGRDDERADGEGHGQERERGATQDHGCLPRH